MIKYTTLWQILMKEFEPGLYLVIVGGLGSIVGMNLRTDSDVLNKPVSEKVKADFIPRFNRWKEDCIRLELAMSAISFGRLVYDLSNKQMTQGEFGKSCDDLRLRLTDEMDLRKFFSIEPDKQIFLESTNLFGDGVSSAFPSATFDIEEAGKCLAFERWTASVSHLMKILEMGLSVLAKDLDIPSGQENWQYLIDQIEKRIRDIDKKTDGPDWKTNRQFYSEAALHFQFVKTAWRNHVMHIRQFNYDEERAIGIYNHVKEFMVLLASRCHE